jgi:hypothetical protein
MKTSVLSKYLKEEWLNKPAAKRFMNLVRGPFNLEDAVF